MYSENQYKRQKYGLTVCVENHRFRPNSVDKWSKIDMVDKNPSFASFLLLFFVCRPLSVSLV